MIRMSSSCLLDRVVVGPKGLPLFTPSLLGTKPLAVSFHAISIPTTFATLPMAAVAEIKLFGKW